MKKNYMTPSVKVATIKVQHILAGSNLTCGGTTGENLSKQSADLGFDDQEPDKSWGAIW